MAENVTLPPMDTRLCRLERVAIFGSADIMEDHPVYKETFNTARELAAIGKVIIDGGGPGVMAAATLGAEAANGQTVAVTFQPVDMPEFEGRYAGNVPDLEIKTKDYVQRMFGLIEESDAFVIFQGGTGTLSEWATVWLLAHLHFGNHKPIVLYGEFWFEFMDAVKKAFFVAEKEASLYKIVTTPEQVVQAIKDFELEMAHRCEV